MNEQMDVLMDLRSLADARPVQINLDAIDAWCLMSELQLACRHPENVGVPRQVAEAVARALQVELATTPALQELAEAGWDPTFDVRPGRGV